MDDTRRRRLPARVLLEALTVASVAATALIPLGAGRATANVPTSAVPAAVRTAPAPASARDLALADAALLRSPRAALASAAPRTVAVIGDSVGNDPGEWVSMWAGDLATDRYAFVHHFDWQHGAYFPDVEVKAPSLDGAARGPVTVWNFGWPGGTPQRALDHLAVGVPVKPDLVVVSFGQNLGPAAVVPHYSALLTGLRKRFGAVPVVVTAAHMTPTPRAGQAEGRARLVRWARAEHLGLIDLRGVFDSLPDPTDAMYDLVHPNRLGYRLLAERVEQALVGDVPTSSACTRSGADRVGVTGSTSVAAGAGRRYRATSTVTDACGRPVPHAWVRATWTGGGRTVVVSSETDARGRAPLEALVPARTRLTEVIAADDGTTTGAVTLAVTTR